jgi:RHS repeat-associated protein
VLNWVHANHLGVPLLTTDTAGATATTPNDYFAPGFPGQSRVLSDLYYNRYRDYDPMTGRYIQADPIGLAGGSNPFLYAGGNPVNRVDPWGLAPKDKWYGYDNRIFQNWFHRCWKVDGDPDATQDEIAEAFDEWNRIGRPRDCGNRPPRPRPAPMPAPESCDRGCRERGVKVVVTGGVAYVIYRCIRMLPSLLPPLWETIPANAVIP